MRGIAVCLLAFALHGAGWAQTPEYKAPRTPDGHADLQGVWTARFATPFELPPDTPGPVVTPEQAAAIVAEMTKQTPALVDPDFFFYNLQNLAEVKGTLRSSIIVEPATGQMPLTPAGKKLVDEYDRLFVEAFDNPEERDNFERCLAGTLQAPIRPLPIPFPYQIVQTPDALVIWGEDVQAVRLVSIGGSTPPAAVTSREGWSSGRWDGDTLEITTTHLQPGDWYRPTIMRSLVVSPESRITERLTRVSPTELLYAFSVEDKALYTQPVRGEFVMRSDDMEAVYEYACHEGNYSLFNMLSAGRAADRKAKPKPRK